MPEPAQIDAAPAGPPDWDSTQAEILCPLCEYNLRGLIEPRCPECGHQFLWSEVLSVGDRIHPFLFEHQTQRSAWALVKTSSMSMLPGRFWKSVIAIHKPVPTRLVLYWAILLIPMLSTCAGLVLFDIVPSAARLRQSMLQDQQQTILTINKDRYWLAQLAPQIAKYGSVKKYVEATQFIPSTTNLVLSSLSIKALLMLTIVVWPWLTLLSLLVFRASMVQARIKTGHVLRCVVYANDLLLLIAPMLLLTFDENFRRGGMILPTLLPQIEVIAAALILAVLTYRLGRAYRLYLRFPHVAATVIASQLMVGLALVRLYFLWWGF